MPPGLPRAGALEGVVDAKCLGRHHAGLRAAAQPEIPAIAESPAALGLAKFDINTWFGLFGPAKMAPETVKTLNAAFVEAVERTGATFIGPPASAMDKMGNKIHAKNLMIKHGVPVTPDGMTCSHNILPDFAL